MADSQSRRLQRWWSLTHSKLGQQVWKDFVRIKIFFGNRAGRSSMVQVVTRNLCHAGGGFFNGRENQEASVMRINVPDACVLGKDGLSAREVHNAAVAEPSALCLDVHVLGDHELGFGVLN